MIIEKINDNQIRCILNEEDLKEHKIKLSELAFGSKRTRELFKHMMEQAFDEVGFDADNTPLMIEAMPITADSIMLVVTKVDNPDDIKDQLSNIPTLDLRDEAMSSEDDDEEEDDDDIFDLFDDEFEIEDENGIIDINIGIDMQGPGEEEGSRLSEDEKKAMLKTAMDLIAPFTKALEKAKAAAALQQDKPEVPDDSDKSLTDTAEEISSVPNEKAASPEHGKKKVLKPLQYYIFDSLDRICEYSQLVSPFYMGESAVYKEESSNLYYLALLRYNSAGDCFERACHLASDYATSMKPMYTTHSYMKEHFKVILKEQAIETLASL